LRLQTGIQVSKRAAIDGTILPAGGLGQSTAQGRTPSILASQSDAATQGETASRTAAATKVAACGAEATSNIVSRRIEGIGIVSAQATTRPLFFASPYCARRISPT
jgi:hypothetical protein